MNVWCIKTILKNPTINDALALYDSIDGNLVKTICDAEGNIYIWNGDVYEHREIMNMHSIPDELYDTARRVYKDFGGKEELMDILKINRDISTLL